MRELSPIGNAEQLHKFKKESQTELGNIRKIFEESINQVSLKSSSRRTLLVALFDRYNEMFNNLLSVCENLYLTVVLGRNDLCLKNIEGLRNKNTLRDSLKCLVGASSSNKNLCSAVKNINLMLVQSVSTSKLNAAEVFNVHKLYKLQLQRINSNQRTFAEENCHCFNMVLTLAKLFCERNLVTIIDQLQTSKHKWLTIYDRSFLLMRKLITQLYETLVACTEGIMRFSEHLEHLFMSSKYHLDELLGRIHKFEIFLHPTFEDDVKNRNPEYAKRATVQLVDIHETANKVLKKISALWTVQKSELINHIGLNTCQYEANNEADRKDKDENASNIVNAELNEHFNIKAFKPTALSSTLRLNCSSQNVAQPKFYKELFKISKSEINLSDLKLLLKSATDEFHELFVFMKENLNDQHSFELFNWLDRLQDVFHKLSNILTIQERNLIKLININDIGLSTFIHMVEKFKDNLSSEQEDGPFFDLNQLRDKFEEWKELFKLDVCNLLQLNSLTNESSLGKKENSIRNDKFDQNELTTEFNNQSTLNLIINMQQTLNQRLCELNLNLVNNVNKIDKKQSNVCQKLTTNWLSTSIIWICLNNYNAINNSRLLFEKIYNSKLISTYVTNKLRTSQNEKLCLHQKDVTEETEVNSKDNSINTVISTSCIVEDNDYSVTIENQDYNHTDDDDNEWITSCFNASYQKLQNYLNDFKTKPKLEDIIQQITSELEYISASLNINTSLVKYFKDQMDIEVWKQQRNELNLARKEFIQAWCNLSSEIFHNLSEKLKETTQAEISKEDNEEHELPKFDVSIDLNHLREFNQNGFFCIDSLDYINRQIHAASERKKAAYIKRKNIEDSIRLQQEMKNQLEKELEDIDKKLNDLRTRLGDAFESMQLDIQQRKC
ncbi:DNA double-strand break repair rad50 ATPase [Schistosoma japonicum]|nr:DNA double-strand break repair rad50 ATPase [Schistosoma japonicum]KAH8850625.1 DNA double-strand break repair rad50 ATPase [Schistosoma japonicum]